ncbi:MAG: major capsid protein [Desulfatirhabdiaceae bacterium]
MRGDAIPELKQTALQKLITRFQTAANLVLMKMFGSDRAESEDITWEAQVGNRRMTPFAAEDAPAPMVGMEGISEHSAHAAFWKEKMYLGASFMNNIREPGNSNKHYAASKLLATNGAKLRNRCDRRKEWMFCQMLTNGGFTYLDKRGSKVSVDYGIPAANLPTLESTRLWNQDTADVLEDWYDIVESFQYASQTKITHAMVTSEVVRAMTLNKGLQTLLQKSAFGNGDLLARPAQVIASLLDIPNFLIYDEMYEVRCWMSAALASGAGPHTIYVDEVGDIEVGDVVYGVRINTEGGQHTKTAAMTVTAVSASAGTITATGTIATALRPQMDYIYTLRKFLPKDRFTVFSETIEGQKLAEFAEAPFDLDRHYGMKVDSDVKWDPDGIYIRVQNKGLPLLYFEDAVYSVKVL